MKFELKLVGRGLLLCLLFLVLTVSFTSAALVDNGDGTVSDTETGLMWQQAEAGAMNWQSALSYCEDLVLPTGGYDDWRLPDRNELQSLVDYSRYNPCLDKTYFPGVLSSYYWSSTTNASYTSSAWLVYFSHGVVNHYGKSGSVYVRAVRSGQSGPLDDSAILTILPSRRTVSAQEGVTTFSVSNSGDGDMDWSAYTGDSWLMLAGGHTGTNSGTITVAYANNSGGPSRTGTVTVNAPGAENSPQVLLVTQSHETSLAGILHHFEFSTISSPQEINDSFSITVTAEDVYNNPVFGFNDRISLFSSLGRVNPTRLTFSSGTASANVTLYDVGNSYLCCDGCGCQGQSNSFDVNGVSQCLSDVTGSLVDEKGDPVVGAKVMALLNPYGSSTQEVVTDAQGKYTFSDLPCGKYYLRVLATDIATGNPVTQIIDFITADGGRLLLSCSTIKINTHTYGTPVILVAGIMGSSSNGWKIPGLSRAKPDREVEIFDKKKFGWKSLEDYLESDFLTFDCPWDWRLGADEAAREYLMPVINEALQRSTTGKVHIIAHSMGGLLARALIQSDILYGVGVKYYEKIDKLAMIGTPHLGSCNPYYIWEGGDPKGLDDLVETGPTNAYTRVFKKLWEKTYGKKKWSTRQHCEIVDFLVDDVYGGYDKPSSLRQLMYVDKFLTLKSDRLNLDEWWGVTTAGNENKWLKNLNASVNVNRMTDDMGDDSKVRTMIFAGFGEDTIDAVHVRKFSSVCPEGKYLEGVPEQPVTKESNVNWLRGDGTVPFASATWPVAEGWAAQGVANNDTAHAKLPGKFNAQIYTFLAGVAKTAIPLRTADEPTSTLTFTIDNSQRFIISDPSGNRAGIDPDTGAVVDEIAGAYMLFDGRQGIVSLPDPVGGSYTITYFGGPEREFDLTISYSADGDDLELLEKSGFCPDSPTAVEVVFDPLADPVISFARSFVDCNCLPWASPHDHGGQLKTWLSWYDLADAVSYRVYTVAETEPYFHKLADVDKSDYPQYFTDQLWRDSEEISLRVYVITAIDSAGNESFFSDKFYNDDRDLDGLTDIEELAQGTGVDNPDTDGDGLLDGDEVHAGSFPDDSDTDDDGYGDYDEVQGHSDPRFADSIPDIHVNADGYCNGEHYCYPTIAKACHAAKGVGNIKVGRGSYPETLVLNENKLLNMAGGWNSDYTTADADSVVVGSLTISSGCLVVEKLIVGGQ